MFYGVRNFEHATELTFGQLLALAAFIYSFCMAVPRIYGARS